MSVPDLDKDTAAAETASRMAAAAAAWLDALDPAQRAAASGDTPGGPSDAERQRWFYTPTDHGGLALSAQSPAQQRLAHQLVASGLSHAGYVTVATIIGLENVLDHAEGWVADWERARGRDPGLYYLRVFGEPGGAEPWAWRFGGHHVSLNNLIADGRVRAVTPCFLGADPAVSPLLGPEPLRPLGGAEDLARELMHSLGPDAAAQATLLNRAPSDIIGGNRPRLADGDRMIPLRHLWNGTFTDPKVVSDLHRADTQNESATGYDSHRPRPARADRRPEGPARPRARGQPAQTAAQAAGRLPGTGPRRAVAAAGLRRRRGPGRHPPGLGRAHRPGPAAVLPAAGPRAAHRVRQRPAAGEPRALGMARPGVRLRLRRARRPPGRAPPLRRSPEDQAEGGPAASEPRSTLTAGWAGSQ